MLVIIFLSIIIILYRPIMTFMCVNMSMDTKIILNMQGNRMDMKPLSKKNTEKASQQY